MEILVDGWNKHLLPRIHGIGQRSIYQHRFTISASILVLGLYLGLNELTKPPKNLRHLPQASFWGYMKSLITNKPIDEIAHDILLPAAQKSQQGLYTMFDRNGWAVHITQPNSAKKMLYKTNIFVKAAQDLNVQGTLLHRFFLGPNMAFLNGSAWKNQRMIANPAFHRSFPIDLFGNLAVKLFEIIDAQGGPTTDVYDMMERYGLDVIGKAAFDFEFHAMEDNNNEWVQIYNELFEAAQKPLFVIFPMFDTTLRFMFPGREKKHRQLTKFLGMIDNVIKHKHMALQKNQSSDIKEREKDLLTLMIEAGDEGKKPLTDDELKSNLCIFFAAGHDTTATSLSIAIYYLAVHQDIQKKAREEVLRVLEDEPEDAVPTQEQMQEMKYINMVIKEVLRIDGPVSALVVREAVEDTELDGVFIPKGTRVVIDIFAMHHSPAVWKDPEVFNPERFAPGGEVEHSGLSWVPFGGGARQCVGMNFSLVEQRVLLPMLLRKYEFLLPENTIHKDKLKLKNNEILAPKQLYIDFKRRY